MVAGAGGWQTAGGRRMLGASARGGTELHSGKTTKFWR